MHTVTDSGPVWQRIVLIGLAVWSVFVWLVVPAGQFVPNLSLLLVAGIVSMWPGNRTTKLIVLGLLGILTLLSAISPVWV